MPVPPIIVGIVREVSIVYAPVPKVPANIASAGSPVALVNTRADGVPKSGVMSVGEVFITKVLPVPVCEATAVALPTEVMGPVRLALVVTVAALPPMLRVLVDV